MKEFNLEEYLANPSRKVVTRDGRDVRIICTDFNNPDFPIICGIKGSKWPHNFATNGLLIKGTKHSNDLFFAPEKHEGWINLYKDAEGIYVPSQIYKTKESAEAVSCRTCIATVKIEWEE